MSNKGQQQKARSKSRKKGISVSLTPQKSNEMPQISSFDFSQCSVRQIHELPTINYQGSNSKNNRTINFIYQSPNTNSLFKREVQSAQTQKKALEIQAFTTKKYCDQSSTKKQQTVFEKAKQIKKGQEQQVSQRKPRSQEIRPSVFNIVEEISNKLQNASKSPVKQLVQQKNLELNIRTVSEKVPQKAGITKLMSQNLEVIHQNTIETSEQLYKPSVLNTNEINKDSFLIQDKQKKQQSIKSPIQKGKKVVGSTSPSKKNEKTQKINEKNGIKCQMKVPNISRLKLAYLRKRTLKEKRGLIFIESNCRKKYKINVNAKYLSFNKVQKHILQGMQVKILQSRGVQTENDEEIDDYNFFLNFFLFNLLRNCLDL